MQLMTQVDEFLRFAEDGDLPGLERLLALRPDLVQVHGERGWTALHRAAVFGHTEVVKLLLREGANPAAIDERRRTPLHDVAMGQEYSFPSMVLLVEAGAPLNARNVYWETPLHLAAGASNLPGFCFLLGLGARTDLRNRQGRDPLGEAQYQLEHVPKSRRFADQRRVAKCIIETLKQAGRAPQQDAL